jgi:hypothetical protein
MMGYQGAQVDYLPGDVGKVKRILLPKLWKADYKVIEDGSSYDQSTITKGLEDPNAPNKVVIDWCTTDADWQAYLGRGSVRGYFWGSHGFMEPYPGCPDDELLKFESRQWTSAPGQPAITESKHFVRQWKELLDKQVAGSLDFAVMHACCTGGLGSYADECWQYCDGSTQARVQAKFGSLPDASKLDTSQNFTTLKGKFGFLQAYDGPSYFGLDDVKFTDVLNALTPVN